MELPNYWNIRSLAIHNIPSFDDRLTRGGPVVKRTGYDVASLEVSTDARKAAVFDFTVQASRGVGSTARSLTLQPGLALKPAPNVFIQLSPTYVRDEDEAQYVTTVSDPTATDFFGNRYVFGFIHTKTVSLDTRVNWTFTPNLTLQLFAQPFIASGRYSAFREFAAPRSMEKLDYGTDIGTIAFDSEEALYRVDPDGAGPAADFTFDDPNFTASSLRGTAVLRWEYRPGSTLYFVWTQERSGETGVGDFDFASARRSILDNHPTNVFQIKATYWLGR
jgi:hypothetical protein